MQVLESMICCNGQDNDLLAQIIAVSEQAELILDAKKLNGGYTTHSALEMLPPFNMDMGVGGIDSRPLCVIIRLTNPGQPSKFLG